MVAIKEIANAERLTIITGAGVSVEVGLPSWDELINRLLSRVAQRFGIDDEEQVREFCKSTIETVERLGAASIAQASLSRQEYVAAIRECLYGEPPRDPKPGETAKALASLMLEFGERCELLTLNWDDLAEKALNEALAVDDKARARWSGVRSIAGQSSAPADEFVVRHLHGYVPTSGRARGPVVLAEPEYHAAQRPEGWQERYVRERLENSRCLFVGSSLRDPNLLRYLYLAESPKQHIALFVRQADASELDKLDDGVRHAREEATEARWARMNLRPLEVDYFIQVAQFLREIVYQRRTAQPRTYSQRLDEWTEMMDEKLLHTRDHQVFVRTQDRLQERLAEIVEAVKQWLRRREVPPAKGERLALSMWVRRPKDRALMNWAGSDRAWRAPETLEPVPIHWRTRWVAVDAFCQGSVVVTPMEQEYLTRWNHVLGVPVFLEDASSGRLPVGVFTFASSALSSESVLHRLNEDGQRALGSFLAGLGTGLFEPQS